MKLTIIGSAKIPYTNKEYYFEYNYCKVTQYPQFLS